MTTYQLIINPNVSEHKMFIEYLSHQFDNLPSIEIIPLKNIYTTILLQDNKVIAKDINELMKVFKFESIETAPSNVEKANTVAESGSKPKTIKDLALEWKKEQQEEEDSTGEAFTAAYREYDKKRRHVVDDFNKNCKIQKPTPTDFNKKSISPY